MKREYPENTSLEQQFSQPSALQQRIAKLKAQHPDSVVVYFTKHKAAPQSLPKPNIPLILFKRQLKIQEVFYGLYQQIQIKKLSYYVLKGEDNNRVSYFNIRPGKTLGQIYDAYSYNNYLALIYTIGPLKKGGFSYVQKKIFRIIFIAGMIYLFIQIFQHWQEYFGQNQSSSTPGTVSNEEN